MLWEYLESIPDLDRVKEKSHQYVRFPLPIPGGSIRQRGERIIGGLKNEFNNFYQAEAVKLTVLQPFGDDEYAAALFARYRQERCVLIPR